MCVTEDYNPPGCFWFAANKGIRRSGKEGGSEKSRVMVGSTWQKMNSDGWATWCICGRVRGEHRTVVFGKSRCVQLMTPLGHTIMVNNKSRKEHRNHLKRDHAIIWLHCQCWWAMKASKLAKWDPLWFVEGNDERIWRKVKGNGDVGELEWEARVRKKGEPWVLVLVLVFRVFVTILVLECQRSTSAHTLRQFGGFGFQTLGVWRVPSTTSPCKFSTVWEFTHPKKMKLHV